MKMIVTVGLRPEGLHIARETGVLPDFGAVFSSVSEVRLVEVFGRGRLADVEVTEESYSRIKKEFRDRFFFTKHRVLEPFS